MPAAVPYTPAKGDNCMLTSGGPMMVVITVPDKDGWVSCHWFNPVDCKICEQRFLSASLVKVDPAVVKPWARG